MALIPCLASLRHLATTRVGAATLLDKICAGGAAATLGVVSRAIHTTGAQLGIAKLPRGQHTIPESHEQVEVSTAEWSYVERLMPLTVIPEPSGRPGEVTPSGWIAPSAKIGDHPYFIPRAASHMMRVYLHHDPILRRFITVVKHVEGDVFALGEELREYLLQRISRKIISVRVHEPHQVVQIKGNYVAEVKEFLLEKGF